MDNAVFNKADKDDVLLLDGSNKIDADIDMNSNSIINLKDSLDPKAAVSKSYVDSKDAILTNRLTDSVNKKLNEPHTNDSNDGKDMF